MKEDTAEYVLQFQAENTGDKFNLQDQRYKNWEEIVEIFKGNK